METTIDGVTYEFVLGSDIQRDGMFLEVSIKDTDPLRQVAEIFYSDVTHQFTVSCFEPDIPLSIIEELIRRARLRLPATDQ